MMGGEKNKTNELSEGGAHVNKHCQKTQVIKGLNCNNNNAPVFLSTLHFRTNWHSTVNFYGKNQQSVKYKCKNKKRV